jgi:hypothetical protein
LPALRGLTGIVGGSRCADCRRLRCSEDHRRCHDRLQNAQISL